MHQKQSWLGFCSRPHWGDYTFPKTANWISGGRVPVGMGRQERRERGNEEKLGRLVLHNVWDAKEALIGTGGDKSPQLLVWGDQQCIGPPNFLVIILSTDICMKFA